MGDAISPIKGQVQCDFQPIYKALKELPEKFVLQDVKTEQRNAWKTVLEAARRNAPVDTGRLQEMIVMRVGYSKKNQQVFAIVGLRKIKRKERERIRQRKIERKISATAHEYDAYYGVFVEFGTEFQDAQPFMRPAFDENFRTVLVKYGEKLRLRLEARIASLKQIPRQPLGDKAA